MLFYKIRSILPLWCRKKRFLSDYIEEDYKKYASNIQADNKFKQILGSRLFIVFLLFLPSVLVVGSAFLASTSCFLLSKNDFYSIATILATLSVVIVMGVVFSVESNRADFPGPGSILQVLIRDLNFFPSIAFVFGSVLSGVIYPSIFYPLANDLASDGVFILCSATSFFMLFLVLHNTLNSVSRGALYSLIAKDFRNKHRLALNEHVYQSLMISYLYSQIDDKSFSWNFLGPGSGVDQTDYELKARGTLVDIDINRLDDFFASHDNTNKNTSKRRPTVKLVPLKDYGNDMVEAISVPEGVDMASSSVIEKCFIWNRKFVTANPDWQLLSQLVSKSAAINDLFHFEKGLDVLFSIASEYLETISALGLEHKQPSFLEKPFLSYSPPTLMTIDFSEIFLGVVKSENQKAVDECCRYLVRFAALAWRHKSLTYYDGVLKLIVGLYSRATTPEVKERLVEVIKGIFRTTCDRGFINLIQGKGRMCLDENQSTEFYTTFLKNVLFLLTQTTQDVQLFDKMYNELLRGLPRQDYEQIVVKGAINGSETAVFTANKIYYYNKLARLAISAWIEVLIKEEQISHDDKMELEKSIGPLFSNLDEVVGLYLFRNYFSLKRERTNNKLGIEDWYKAETSEEGVYTLIMPDTWLLDYWFFIALSFAGKDRSLDMNSTFFATDFRFYGIYFNDEESKRFVMRLDKFIEDNKGSRLLENVDIDKSKARLLEVFRDIRDNSINKK